MPARFTTTFNAFEKGIESIKPDAAIKLIEGWQEELEKTEISGVKGISGDLDSLKKALGADEPDSERIKTLIGKLGDATSKVAGRADDKIEPKLTQLAGALADAE